MNERINQLRLEAGISRLHDEPKFMVAVSKEGTVIEPLDGLEKFAQLIVSECMEVFSKDLPDPTSPDYQLGTLNEVVNRVCNVAEHFGVEE